MVDHSTDCVHTFRLCIGFWCSYPHSKDIRYRRYHILRWGGISIDSQGLPFGTVRFEVSYCPIIMSSLEGSTTKLLLLEI